MTSSSRADHDRGQNTDSEIRMHDGKLFFPNPSILIDCSSNNGPGAIEIDRSWHCGHFGVCIFSENPCVFSELAGMLYFLVFNEFLFKWM